MKINFLERFEFFAGVPDSLLQPMCNYLMDHCTLGKDHIIAPNEGTAVALAAGYYMAHKKVPVVYLQNSGLGNILNPVVSLLNDKVYAFPCVFFVGYRGEPNVKDEPQHIFQGEITLQLLNDMNIETYIIDKSTTENDVLQALERFTPLLNEGKQVAFVVKKGAFEYDNNRVYANDFCLRREEILEHIVRVSGTDPVVSTTGKASRELFEIREKNGQTHSSDFLTVGSMGHSASIAFKIAQEKRDTTVWCIDGDGAILMHMGALAMIGSSDVHNLIHIVINNSAHETVGGVPTVASKIDLCAIAKGCGYQNTVCVRTPLALDLALENAKSCNQLTFIEVLCAIGARQDLGRPTISAKQCGLNFMEYISKERKEPVL